MKENKQKTPLSVNGKHVFYFGLWLAPALNHRIESGLCASIFVKKGLRVAGQSSKAPHPAPSDFMLFTSPVPRQVRLWKKKMPIATRA